MKREIPVYIIGQWLKVGDKYGKIVASTTQDGTWGCFAEYEDNPHVQAMAKLGVGYAVQWGTASVTFELDGTTPTRFTSTRLRWLRAETIAEKRYQPCENPIAPKAEAEKPEATGASNVDAETTIESKDNAESIMRAMVEAGRRAEDWLRAYGFMP